MYDCGEKGLGIIVDKMTMGHQCGTVVKKEKMTVGYMSRIIKCKNHKVLSINQIWAQHQKKCDDKACLKHNCKVVDLAPAAADQTFPHPAFSPEGSQHSVLPHVAHGLALSHIAINTIRLSGSLLTFLKIWGWDPRTQRNTSEEKEVVFSVKSLK